MAERGAAIAEWAAGDDGLFPDDALLARAIREELELLCEGLGELASLDHRLVFGEDRDHIWHRRRGSS
ncbi:MAG: hypothetical protein ACOYEV_07360 [Candidatus Nanopelagicales bacterium]